jgi:hypothetical protein
MNLFPFPPPPVDTGPVPFGANKVLEVFDCYTMVQGGWATVAIRVPAPVGAPYTDEETALMSSALHAALKRDGIPEVGSYHWARLTLPRTGEPMTIYAVRTKLRDEGMLS